MSCPLRKDSSSIQVNLTTKEPLTSKNTGVIELTAKDWLASEVISEVVESSERDE
ncbi:hypothetical protein [Providencia rettgeri]|uniref:hypothetical protein n=1 Tax=Providencia rettgeri TaxID=587 RepID=UPI0018C7B65F|nr:hypothetical protein [Providencia rettgeri]MBG5933555.1 hypothetical protein [Providencia rettgeri]HEM8128525.1 hypothetical protein [Providencia rettgeri]